MPRYYFHIRRNEEFVEDLEGEEFANLTKAKSEAIEAAREILAERLLAGQKFNGDQFEITDEHGIVVEVVPFKNAII